MDVTFRAQDISSARLLDENFREAASSGKAVRYIDTQRAGCLEIVPGSHARVRWSDGLDAMGSESLDEAANDSLFSAATLLLQEGAGSSQLKAALSALVALLDRPSDDESDRL